MCNMLTDCNHELLSEGFDLCFFIHLFDYVFRTKMLRGRRYSHVSKGKEEKKATCLKLFSFPKHPVNDFSPQTSRAFLIL